MSSLKVKQQQVETADKQLIGQHEEEHSGGPGTLSSLAVMDCTQTACGILRTCPRGFREHLLMLYFPACGLGCVAIMEPVQQGRHVLPQRLKGNGCSTVGTECLVDKDSYSTQYARIIQAVGRLSTGGGTS